MKTKYKIFTSNQNNYPVAWIVDNRGNNFSDIYHGETVNQAKQNLLQNLDKDEVFKESEIDLSEVNIS